LKARNLHLIFINWENSIGFGKVAESTCQNALLKVHLCCHCLLVTRGISA